MRLGIVKMRFWRRLGGLLGETWAVLGRSWAVNPGVEGKKPGRMSDCCGPWEDEVFEEEESEEVSGDPARHCHPDYVRGRRILGGLLI